jgi:serine/threonine protein kinase
MTAPLPLLQLTPGELFARDFRVLRPLAEGGMGSVYRVEQLSTGRERALKIMHPQFARDEDTRARFTQEAKVGSRIKSEHVVEVVAAGVDEISGVPWLAMELLEGVELSDFLRQRGRLSAGEVLELMGQLCHGLGEAHRVGLVHRDLKPQNVFVARSHRQGATVLVKVLDFGVAKLVQEGRIGEATQAVGTPRWMAPEQTEVSEAISPAADVWSLGLMAFNLLTGFIYWRTGGTNATQLPALMREMLVEPLVPASVRAAEYGLVAAVLPPGFDAWFARCVDREPKQRFADANIAFDALRPILESSPSAATANFAGAFDADEEYSFDSGPGQRKPATSGDGATIPPPRSPAPNASNVASARPLSNTEISRPSLKVPADIPLPNSDPDDRMRLRRGALMAGVVGVVGVAGLAVILWPHPNPTPNPTPASTETAPKPLPSEFTLTIDSLPNGVDVFEGDKSLGQTPLHLTVDRRSVEGAPRQFVLKHAGFAPYSLVQGPSNEAVHVVASLTALPVEPVVPPTPTGPTGVIAPTSQRVARTDESRPTHKDKDKSKHPTEKTTGTTDAPDPDHPDENKPVIRLNR